MKESWNSPHRLAAVESFRARVDEQERERKRRLTPEDAAEVGHVAVEDIVPHPRTLRIGEKVVQFVNNRNEFVKRRREVQKIRNSGGKHAPGLGVALERRKKYAEKTKEDLRFAEKGYRRKAKKAAVESHTATIQEKMIKDRLATGQLVEPRRITETHGLTTRLASRLDEILQKRAYKKGMKQVRGDAKAFAKHAVSQEEQAAADRVNDFDYAHQEAKARVRQTRRARISSRLYQSGDAYGQRSWEAPRRTQAERLEALQSRSSYVHRHDNERFASVEHRDIVEANAGMSDQMKAEREEYFTGKPVEHVDQPVTEPEPIITTEYSVHTGPVLDPSIPAENIAQTPRVVAHPIPGAIDTTENGGTHRSHVLQNVHTAGHN